MPVFKCVECNIRLGHCSEEEVKQPTLSDDCFCSIECYIKYQNIGN